MAVRSKQLFSGLTGGIAAYRTLYTCPTGYRTILKEIIWENADAASQVCALALTDSSDAFLGVLIVENTANAVVKRVPCWTIVEAGQKLRGYSADHDAVRWVLSGAELLLPS